MSFDEQLRRLFDTTIAELTESARADAERARQEGSEEGRKRGLEEGRQLGVEEGRRQGIEQGRAEAREEAAAQPRDSAELDRLLDGLRAIDRARSLSETLDTVTACAAREASRAAVLLVRDNRFRGWRFIGFDDRHDSESFETSLEEAGVIAAAIGTNSAASSADVPAFARPASGASFAVPLAVAGAAVAVLYADGLDETAQADDVLRRLEALGRHASRTLEALTALKAARALTQPGYEAHAANGDDDADGSAKRYAKLLVSEIKLYHEPAVAAGRRDRDLVMRLGGEIARARVLYEQRVPESVRTRTDYFRDELVRTLADGDATLLTVEKADY